MNDCIKNNIKFVRDKMEYAKKSAKIPKEVKLIAVTKNNGVDAMNDAIDCGITDIGENRVQEILEKYDYVKKGVNWHLIGHLQKNKVKYIIDKIELIHSVDNIELAKEINKRAEAIGKVQKILIQVNVSGEESKFGIAPENCEQFCRDISDLKNVSVRGLMTIAPKYAEKEEISKIFSDLRQISLDISAKKIDNIYMNELSMGMTNDFEVAINEGATLVRVGTGIFGPRVY